MVDILLILQHEEETLNEFTTYFMIEYYKRPIHFLDVTIIIGNDAVGHQYLEPSSCHFYHCKKGIAYS